MRIAVVLAAALAAAAAAGCGADEPPRSPVVANLAALCVQARQEVEALGLPAEVGIEVVPPWSRIGRRLATDVGRLTGETPAQERQLTRLSKLLDEYYAGLKLAYLVYTKTGNAEGYAISVERATPSLTSAGALATTIGAPECAVQPFAET